MRSLKGAVIGLMVGAVVALIYADTIAQEHELGTMLNSALMLLVPFPIGAAGAALLRMPRWGVVAVAGPIATPVLGAALMGVIPDFYLFGFDEMWTTGVWVVAGVLGYVAAAWWARDRWAAITVTGVLLSVHVISGQVRDPLNEWQEALAFRRSGIPLLAPELPGYSIKRAELWTGEEDGTAILLEYTRPDRTDVQVFLRPATAATPKTACGSPFPVLTWGTAGVSCTPSGGDRWIREDSSGEVTAFAWHGSALVQASGIAMTPQELFALLDSLRPITAAQLARV
ncbi:hypothetical protein AB0L65_56880 [Nonomuraea sp. NPDC052116]|uniref:hypothetical protein n=1 Tax=Nonomuraea sp. NPDC052116 TaxID=3155665 RepID=UPI0034173AE0